MITLKSFLQKLDETTVPEALHSTVSSWGHHSKVSPETEAKISKAIPNSNQSVSFPLVDGGLHSSVHEHLSRNGYWVKSLVDGVVEKDVAQRYGSTKRISTSIASALARTKAPNFVVNKYNQFASDIDSAKKRAKEAGTEPPKDEDYHNLHVVISTHPMAIAGMSTGTSWGSCQTMLDHGGRERTGHKLKEASENGSHVAYLVNKDDPTAFTTGLPSKPLARITLAPFHSADGDTVFRPANEIYGNKDDLFADHVSRWATDNYPAKSDTTYKINPNVYTAHHGNGTFKHITIKTLKDRVDNNEPIQTGDAAIDGHVANDIINYGVNKFSKGDGYDALGFVSNASHISNLTQNHVAQLHKLAQDHEGHDLHEDAIQDLATNHGDKFSGKMITDYADKFGRLPSRMLMSPNLPDKIVDTLKPRDYRFVLSSKIKSKHLDPLISDYLGGKLPSSELSKYSDKLSSNQISQLVSSGKLTKDPFGVNKGLLQNPNFNQQHHDELVKSVISDGNGSAENLLNTVSPYK